MGAAFGVWQPGKREGLDSAGEAGSLCWAELYTPDIARAAAFYHTVLGWETSAVSFPGGVYTTRQPAGDGEEGAFGGMVPLPTTPWRRRRTGRTGCRTSAPRTRTPWPRAPSSWADACGCPRRSVPGVGRLARLEDPYGARFAVLRGDPRET